MMDNFQRPYHHIYLPDDDNEVLEETDTPPQYLEHNNSHNIDGLPSSSSRMSLRSSNSRVVDDGFSGVELMMTGGGGDMTNASSPTTSAAAAAAPNNNN